MSDLINRLRNEACGGTNWNVMLNGAADLIEAQAKSERGTTCIIH